MRKADTPSKATIFDVAREAGVSTGTVSRVLNNRPGVRVQTRNRVLTAMGRLEYRPDLAARELSFRQSPRIGLNVAVGSRRLFPFFVLFLEHLISELQSDGFRLEEVPTGSDGLPEYLTDAMVLFGAHDDDPRIPHLQAARIPFVLVGHCEGVRWTRADDYDGGIQATRHLARLGHTEIAHVSGLMNNQAFRDRYRGYLDALQQRDQQHAQLLLDGEFTTLGAYRAIRQAWERGTRFSAVFAASDEMAVGTLAALEDLGLKVPTDISVVGFDDLPELGATLTTIRQDIGAVAGAAVRLLKEGLEGLPVRHEVVPVKLIVRGTTAKRG